MMKRVSALTAALALLGCSESEPERPAQCRAYVSETAQLVEETARVTRAHDRWLDELATAEPPYRRAHHEEQFFREICLRSGERFTRPAEELHDASTGSPLELTAGRAVESAAGFTNTCIDLVHNMSGADRQARQARLQSAIRALREATNATRTACGAPPVE